MNVNTYWLFQSGPGTHRLDEMVEGETIQFRINRNYGRIRKGHTLYLWQTGPDAPLWGWGEVVGSLEEGEKTQSVLPGRANHRPR
jgi:hypothetical protein